MNSGTEPSSSRRPGSGPELGSGTRDRKILSESDVQNRIALIRAGVRKQAALALRRSEVPDLRTRIVDQWVSDARACQKAGDPGPAFADCGLAKKHKIRALKFGLAHLAPAPSDDRTTRAIKQATLSGEVLEQCLGMKPLTMGPQGQGLLEMAFGVIAEVPFVEEAPEYHWLKAAVDHCEHDIIRAGQQQRERMNLMVAQAMQDLLSSVPHRIATRDTIHAMDTPRFCLSDEEMQRFIAGVHKLIDGHDIEEDEMALVERFTPRLQRHVPPAMRADFDNFVDLLNVRKSQLTD